jgi:hypothetical protein
LGFETKSAALNWGRDQGAKFRRGRWADLNAGKVTVSEWIDRWLAIHDVGPSTEENREYPIRLYLRPPGGAPRCPPSPPKTSPSGRTACPPRQGSAGAPPATSAAYYAPSRATPRRPSPR